MAAPAYVAVTAAVDLFPTEPSGAAPFHVVLVNVNCEDGATAVVTPPPGFAQVTNLFDEGTATGLQLMGGVYWIRRGYGIIPNNWFISAGGGARIATPIAYSGVINHGNPWNGTPVLTQGSDSTAEFGTVTTTVNESTLVGLMNVWTWASAVTTTAGWTERLDGGTTGPCTIVDQELATAGASPTLVITGDANWMAHLLALTPDDGDPEPQLPPGIAAYGALFAAASGTSITPVIPASAALNDVMVFQAMVNTASTFSTPTDWAVLGTAVNSANQSTAWFWKRHDGSESNPTSTTSATGSTTAGLYGRIYVIPGCITTGDPFEDVQMAGTPTLSTTPQTAAVDTTGDNRLVVSFVSVDDDNPWTALTNPPALWGNVTGTSRVVSTTGGDCMMDAIFREVPTAATVAAVTIGTMASDYWRSLTLAFIPLPGGTDATVSPAPIAVTATLPAPTEATGWTPAPAVLATTVTTPASTRATGSSVAPAALATVVTSPATTRTTGATATPVALAVVTTLPAPTESAGATLTTTVLTAVTTLPAATGSGAATVTPAAVATTVTLPSSTRATGSTVTPAVLASVVTLPASTRSTGWTVAPPVLAAVVTLPAATGSAAANVTPTALATVASFPASTRATGSTVSSAVLLTVATLPATTRTTGSTVTPAALATVATLPAVTVGTGAGPTPSALATVVTVPVAAVAAGASLSLAVLAAAVTFPPPTVTAGGSATVTPAAVATVVTLPVSSISAGWTVSPTVLASVVTLPAAAAGAGVLLSPAVLATVASFPASIRALGSTVTTAPLATVLTLPAATYSTGWRVNPAALATVVTLPSVAAGGGTASTPAVLATVVTLPAASAAGGTSSTVTPASLLVVLALPAPAVSFGWVATPAVLLTVVTLNAVNAIIAGQDLPAVSTLTISAPASAHSVVAPSSLAWIRAAASMATVGAGVSTESSEP